MRQVKVVECSSLRLLEVFHDSKIAMKEVGHLRDRVFSCKVASRFARLVSAIKVVEFSLIFTFAGISLDHIHNGVVWSFSRMLQNISHPHLHLIAQGFEDF